VNNCAIFNADESVPTISTYLNEFFFLDKRFMSDCIRTLLARRRSQSSTTKTTTNHMSALNSGLMRRMHRKTIEANRHGMIRGKRLFLMPFFFREETFIENWKKNRNGITTRGSKDSVLSQWK
jgi:hypothetical protein